MKLSVLVPSIRPENLLRLYDSIDRAFSGDWEMVVASPYSLPSELEGKCKFICTYRSPIASQQQALLASTGDYISWAADDGYYLPGSLDRAFELIGDDYKTIVTGKYHEGDNQSGMSDDKYYVLWTHDSMRLGGVPKDAYMLNCGVISRKLCLELGGWEASRFQVCPLSYSDFAIRAYKYGAKFILQQEIMFKCGHMPNESGDHKPVHRGQVYYDHPVFEGMYRSPSDRMIIDINNWENSSNVWRLRFGGPDER